MPKDFFLPRIYPVTDRQISGIPHSEQVRMLIDGGATFIQIRDKEASSLELYRDVEESLKIAHANGTRLIVNDRVDIAFSLKADSVHLGQDDLSPTEARKFLGDQAIIGFSTHCVEQAISAMELPIDYIAIGPIFATNTKADHEKPVGLEGIETVKKAIGQMPLVAIGGIGIDNINAVLSAGADAVALISALLSQPAQIAENASSAIATASSFK